MRCGCPRIPSDLVPGVDMVRHVVGCPLRPGEHRPYAAADAETGEPSPEFPAIGPAGLTGTSAVVQTYGNERSGGDVYTPLRDADEIRGLADDELDAYVEDLGEDVVQLRDHLNAAQEARRTARRAQMQRGVTARARRAGRDAGTSALRSILP